LPGNIRPYIWLLVVSLAVVLTGCQEQINFPAPSATGISPTQMSAGQPAFTLTVTGSNFTPSTAVLWNGSPRATFFTSTSVLTAEIGAGDIQNPGKAFITVFTPQPGGGTSPKFPITLTFTINGVSSPVPQITSLSPSGAFAGSSGLSLTVSGSNFVAQSLVTVNGATRPTSFSNSTTLTASVFTSDMSTAGTLQIAVLNPEPDGGISSSIAFSVKNPVPGSTSLTPIAAPAGSSGATLTLTGVGYVPTSVVNINGAPRVTTFINSTQVEVTLTSGDFASAGINQVVVVNPAPGGGSSNILTFAVNPTDLAGLPELVDLGPNGVQANNGVCGPTCTGGTPTLTTAGPSTSLTGQFIAFASTSTNLVANQTNGLSNIFIRNTCLVATSTTSSSCAPSTFVASATPNGIATDGASSEPSIDSAGSNVAYTSTASNLVNYVIVPGGARQVYWQRTCTVAAGCASGSTGAALVSISADGTSPGNGESYNPVISPDGVYVAFVSTATNLVGNVLPDGVTPQVYVRNTCSLVPPTTGGCVPTTYLVSTPDGTTTADAASSEPAISNTGLFVAFTSQATNLGATAPNPLGASEVFVNSTCVTTIGTIDDTCVQGATLVSTPDGTTPADGVSSEAAISTDGRFIAFASTAKNILTGVGPTQQIYVRDTCTLAVITPVCVPSTSLASTPDGSTAANGLSENPSINKCGNGSTTVGGGGLSGCATGQYISFSSLASNLNANVQNGVENVFVRDTCSVFPTSTTIITNPCVPYTLLASQPGGATPPQANGSSVEPALSGDGHTVSFISFANNLVPNDTNNLEDVFLAGANLSFTLTATMAGTGSGTLTDDQSQINCVQTAASSTVPLSVAGTCNARYISGSVVTLTATAGSGFTFQGFGGSVVGTNCLATEPSGTTFGTCVFGVTADSTVTATFK
jgi:WD40-like Beta Propeller Repeat